MLTRRIYLNNAFNVRDLGGYRTLDGGVTNWRTLLRADALSALDAEDWEILLQNDVRTVVDLRSAAEIQLMPDCVPEEIRYVACPLQRENLDLRNPQNAAEQAFSLSLTQGYRHIVTECTDLLQAAVAAVLEGLAHGAVLFHCTAGKDRTGVLAAVLLYLLGVQDEDIIADYQVSHTYNRGNIYISPENSPQHEALRHLFSSEPENMADLLALFKTLNLPDMLNLSGRDLAHLRALCIR